MTKILNIDVLQVAVEKQSPNHSCKWCVFLKVRKRKKEKLILMFKLNQKPHIKFFHNTGNIISESNTVFNDVFKKDNYFIDKSIKLPKYKRPMKQDGLTRKQMINYLINQRIKRNCIGKIELKLLIILQTN